MRDTVAGQRDHPLDVALFRVARIVEDHHVAAMDGRDVVDELVDEEAVVVLQARQHAGAFHAHRLVEEHDDEDGHGRRDDNVADPEEEAPLAGAFHCGNDSIGARTEQPVFPDRPAMARLVVGYGYQAAAFPFISTLLATEASRRAHHARAVRLVDAVWAGWLREPVPRLPGGAGRREVRIFQKPADAAEPFPPASRPRCSRRRRG